MNPPLDQCIYQLVLRPLRIFGHEAGLVRPADRLLRVRSFLVKLSADVGVHSGALHGPSTDEETLNELVRVVSQDLTVLARSRLAFICVDEVLGSKEAVSPGSMVH
jgi:hypothetical protein